MLVSIVYPGGTAHAAKKASAVASGARSVPGVECHLVDLSAGGVPWGVLDSSAAIVFGSSTRGGTERAEVDRFFEDSTGPAWRELRWRNKVAAGFTTSGTRPGDSDLDPLVTLASFAAQHGMVWVGLDLLAGDGRPGSILDRVRRREGLGAMTPTLDAAGATETPSERDLRMAAYLGHRVAHLAWRLHREP